jgi:hypothetical protein
MAPPRHEDEDADQLTANDQGHTHRGDPSLPTHPLSVDDAIVGTNIINDEGLQEFHTPSIYVLRPAHPHMAIAIRRVQPPLSG